MTYNGTEMPLPDGDIILTDEQVDSAVSKYFANPAPGYELIETITLDEDTAGLTRTQEPDGTPYRFERMYMQLYAPTKGGAANNCVFYYGNVECGAFWLGGSTTDKSYRACEIRQDSGGWRTTWCDWNTNVATVNSRQAANEWGRFPDKSIKDYPYIDRVVHYGTLPAGTEIKIWAVRASKYDSLARIDEIVDAVIKALPNGDEVSY